MKKPANIIAAAAAAIAAAWAAFLWVDPRAAAQRRIEGHLEDCLYGCGFAPGELCPHEEACRCVETARADCVDAGLERICADDWTETNRGALGCP